MCIEFKGSRNIRLFFHNERRNKKKHSISLRKRYSLNSTGIEYERDRTFMCSPYDNVTCMGARVLACCWSSFFLLFSFFISFCFVLFFSHSIDVIFKWKMFICKSIEKSGWYNVKISVVCCYLFAFACMHVNATSTTTAQKNEFGNAVFLLHF